MSLDKTKARAPWSLREALLLLLFVSLLQSGLLLSGLISYNSVAQLAWWSLVDALLYLGGVGFVLFRKGSGLVELGLKAGDRVQTALIGVGAGMVIAGSVLAIGELIVKVSGKSPSVQTVQEVAGKAVDWKQILLVVIISCLIVPIKEEVVYRGFLYPALRDRAGVVWGIILTSVFFALVHGDVLRFLPLMLGGIMLNAVYQKTGSLYSAIAAHGVWNGIMTLLVFWR